MIDEQIENHIKHKLIKDHGYLPIFTVTCEECGRKFISGMPIKCPNIKCINHLENRGNE